MCHRDCAGDRAAAAPGAPATRDQAAATVTGGRNLDFSEWTKLELEADALASSSLKLSGPGAVFRL